MASDPIIRAAATRIRDQQRDVERYEKLEKVQSYLKEHGSEIKPTVRFAASSVPYHDEAADFVKTLFFDDWSESGRRRAQVAVETEMKAIKERLT